MPAEKIATCCYCGRKSLLTLEGSARHELACRACGAPLRDLKRLKAEHPVDRSRAGPPRHRGESTHPKARRRKGPGRRFLEEALDLVEDLFD